MGGQDLFSIGEVSEFLGLSRDTLKFYEEKNLVNPVKDKENGYRRYNMIDIHNIFLINFYRELDIEIKNIQNLRSTNDVESISNILLVKEELIKEEIRAKKRVLAKIKDIRENYKKIEDNLNKFSIREMERYEILYEIEDYNLEDPKSILDKLKNAKNDMVKDKKPHTLNDLIKVVEFNGNIDISEKYLIVKKLKAGVKAKGKVLEHKKCAYGVLKNKTVNSFEEGEIEMAKGKSAFLEYIKELNEKSKDLVYIKMILGGYEDGVGTLYAEIYGPLE